MLVQLGRVMNDSVGAFVLVVTEKSSSGYGTASLNWNVVADSNPLYYDGVVPSISTTLLLQLMSSLLCTAVFAITSRHCQDYRGRLRWHSVHEFVIIVQFVDPLSVITILRQYAPFRGQQIQLSPVSADGASLHNSPPQSLPFQRSAQPQLNS